MSKTLRAAYTAAAITLAGMAGAVALTAPAFATGGVPPQPPPIPGNQAPDAGPGAGPDAVQPGKPGKPGPAQDGKPAPFQGPVQHNKPGNDSPDCDLGHDQVCKPGMHKPSHSNKPDGAGAPGHKPVGGNPGADINNPPAGDPGDGNGNPSTPDTSPSTAPDNNTGTTPGGNNAVPAGDTTPNSNTAPAGNTGGKTTASNTLPKTGPGNPTLLITLSLTMITAGVVATAWALRRRVTFKA